MRYIDITVTIANGMKKYSTDPCVRIRRFKSLRSGGSCNLLKLELGSHTGTHIDAPRHMSDGRAGIDRIKADRLICDVLVTDINSFFGKSEKVRITRGLRGVIFKGRLGKSGLTMAEANILLRRGVTLVGTEAMSIEGSADRNHPVHRFLLANGMVIVESLKLNRVKKGRYMLICLPLKIKNGDGAPARAILIHD